MRCSIFAGILTLDVQIFRILSKVLILYRADMSLILPLTDFLIDTKCCILNDRNMSSNDYTCIKSQGASVVDYCLVPHEDLDKFTKFKVHKVTKLFNEIYIIGSIEPDTSKPDQSILTWKTNIDII